MNPLPIRPAPEWAAALAAGRITTADVPDASAVHKGTDGVQYVRDDNPPPTLVPLTPERWRRTCTRCGWPITGTATTHPTCEEPT